MILIGQENAFYSKKIPPISLDKYLERLLKYSEAAESTIIIMLIYIDKICEKSSLNITNNCIHRYELAKE